MEPSVPHSTTLTVADLERRVTTALLASNVSEANAQSVVRALVGAEIDGQAGHGISRVASYAAQARAGKIDGHATPALRESRPATVVVDAAHGFAYPAIELAIRDLVHRTRRTGIAAAGIVRSHHAGAVGRHAEALAGEGLVALFFANTPHAMAAHGGSRPVFGTNPIAFACPRPDGAPPIVIDMALSTVARGRIVNAAERGEAIPSGWANDATGRPTTDAKSALAGTLRPVGDAKGAALALMVEILAAGLTGATLAADATSFLDTKGGPPGTGQLLITLAPDAFGGDGALAQIARLAQMIEADAPARLPGASRPTRRAAADRDGVTLTAATIATLDRLASEG